MKNASKVAVFTAGLYAASSGAEQLEELAVSARYDARTIDITETLEVSPDITQLLTRAPGANVNRNGPLVGIPQYRGLFGPRVAVSLDGRQLAPAGPNWMDPPMSYAVTAQLESLEVYRGIAPVSVAQESIGGAIDVRTRHRDFGARPDFDHGGRLAASVRSVSEAYQLDGDFQASNEHHRFKLAAMIQEGSDADFPGGTILPSEYERERYDVGYGLRRGNHSLQFDYGYNNTGDTGTPALPMDIEYIRGDLYNLAYRLEPQSGIEVEVSVYTSELDHGMTNFHLRRPPAPDGWRRNIAATDNFGFKAQARWEDGQGSWFLGVDGFSESHDSDIDNPSNLMFFVENFNGAEREIAGLFLEREQALNVRWSVEFGLRYNRVHTDAGEVNASPALIMPPARALRDAFNAADRDRRDDNVDALARIRHTLSGNTTFYAGLARKMRSPAYQERYLWLPLEATGGLADGQLYTGDVDLGPEESRIVEFGFDFSNGGLTLSPRLFYNRVDDYIQGVPLGPIHPATMLVRMMNAANGTDRPDPLQFGNVDAELYGFDMDWNWSIDETWSLSGLANYVRGQRRDSDDNLFRIAPPNMTLRLDYRSGDWGVTLENVLYARQEHVSNTNREQTSPGYGLVNLRGSWQITGHLQLAAGIDNLFDKTYRSHLGGYNRASNPNINPGQRLPGYGVDAYVRVVYLF